MAGDTGFITYNPGPGAYTSRTSDIGSRFINRDNLMNKIIAPTKVVNDPEIYFTNDKGIISKNYQTMAADKTIR